MTKENAIKLFEDKQVRSVWDEDAEKWYISIVDVVSVLTDSVDGRKYWNKLKQRLKEEGNETVTNCHQLKMQASDGKMRLTDVADVEQLFRMMEYYHRKGYSDNWINQRLKSIEVRRELTDEWERRGVKKGQEFATLTDIITHGWAGMTTKEYKRYKGLKTESLRDNMTNLELVLNMLAEATTTEISKEKKPKTVAENRKIAYQGGTIAGNTRKEIEAKTGKKVVSRLNAKALKAVEADSADKKKK